MKQPAVEDEDPNRPMTRRGPDGKAHETSTMEERARESQRHEQEQRPAPVRTRTPPD